MDSVNEGFRGQIVVKLAGPSRVRGLILIMNTKLVLRHASFVSDAARSNFGVI